MTLLRRRWLGDEIRRGWLDVEEILAADVDGDDGVRDGVVDVVPHVGRHLCAHPRLVECGTERGWCSVD